MIGTGSVWYVVDFHRNGESVDVVGSDNTAIVGCVWMTGLLGIAWDRNRSFLWVF